MAITSSVSLTIPKLAGKLLDIFSSSTGPPTYILVGLPIVLAAGALANTARVVLLRISAERIVKRLRDEGFARVLGADSAKRDLGTGDVLARLNSDATLLGNLVSRDLLEGLRSVVIAGAGMGMMFFISQKMTLLMLTLVPPAALATTLYGRYLKKLSQKVQSAIAGMTSVGEETMRGQTTVHAFNATPYEVNRFEKSSENVFELSKKEGWANAAFYGAFGFGSGNCTLFALLIYGGHLVQLGEITVGELTSLLLYTFYVGSSLVGESFSHSSLMKGLGASRRVFALLDIRPISVHLRSPTLALPPPTSTALAQSTTPISLKLQNIKFAYPSRSHIPILESLDLALSPAKGRLVAVTGRSGSGKSSVAALMMRYYDPQEGQILVNGKDVRELEVEEWRNIISIVPQEIMLFSGSIKQNIAYGLPNATDEEVRNAAELAQCEFLNEVKGGWDANVGPSSGSQLSGGQKQRLAIARAVIRKPKILIMDEATSALDTRSEALINHAIRRIADEQNTLVVVIAHRLSTIRGCDRVVFVDDGRVVEDGTFEELMLEGKRFREFVREGGKAL
ncbi:P-loop containing nucleoside triphosphate hydrolase protein [Atractiella rhizophila]|nr:P-loop containing nucleoside triphosphate hydrolase protein [Atractiella rhizophila]